MRKEVLAELNVLTMVFEYDLLENLFTISKGKKHIELNNGKYMYIQIDDLHGTSQQKFTDEKGTEVVSDDIIIAWDGANAGKVGVGFSGMIGSTLARLRPIKRLNSKFLFWYLDSEFDNIKSQRTGATIPHVNGATLRSLKIPIPPLAIQEQIANALDNSDAIRRKDHELLRKYDVLAQSIFYEMFGDPVRNEKDWEIVRLEQLGEWKSGGTPSRSNSNYFNGTISWLSSGELESMYVRMSKEKITYEAIENSAVKLIKPRSLLLGMYDTAALKSSINIDELSCNQAIAFAKLDDFKCSTEFVYFYIQLAKDHLKREQRGVRQKNMNLSMIRNLPVINPPLELQNTFTKALEYIENQKKIGMEGAKHSKLYFEGLLKQYFS